MWTHVVNLLLSIIIMTYISFTIYLDQLTNVFL
jgi:hypothetical protein